MKILFVRPPRHFWPFNSESSSFWQPLGFASMAAVLRKEGFNDVEILDCLPLKIGWKSLREELEKRKPDILCVGDETASFYESVRLMGLAKELNPNVICIAGGYHFGNTIDLSFKETKVDFIVKGEGELTLLELIRALYSGKKKFDKILGIAYKDKNGIVIINKSRPLIKDLDSLPLPAYDLLPMEMYGKDSANHKDFAAIEHGRGCTGGCNFCSIWTQMPENEKPCYRTKSAKRCIEETKLLVEKYGRKTLNWVDGTFNLDPEWSREYFESLELNEIKVQHTAWMRADCIIRDEKNGVLKKMVDNGLVQAIVGMERLDDSKILGTHGKEYYISMEAFKILKKYPSVYVIASLIYGLPEDGKKELKQLRKFIYKNIVDFQFILPYTPYPGTVAWQEYKDKFTSDDFKAWNLHRPIMGTNKLTRNQLDRWFKGCLLMYLFHPNFYVRNYLEKDERKKRVQKSLSKKLVKGLFRGVADSFRGNKELEYGRKPEWYDD